MDDWTLIDVLVHFSAIFVVSAAAGWWMGRRS